MKAFHPLATGNNVVNVVHPGIAGENAERMVVHQLVKAVHQWVKAFHPSMAGKNTERMVKAVHPSMADEKTERTIPCHINVGVIYRGRLSQFADRRLISILDFVLFSTNRFSATNKALKHAVRGSYMTS